MDEDVKQYVYYFINRPPFIGTHPRENLVSQLAFPIPATVVGFGERRFHGLASYSSKLTFEQIWQYELYPENVEELFLYNEWREENNK